MEREILYVDNLKCAGCATTITNSLLSINSVSDVLVKEEEGSVEFTHDGSNKLSVFIKKLSQLGYPERGTSTLLQKGRSYVSCAIGKIK